MANAKKKPVKPSAKPKKAAKKSAKTSKPPTSKALAAMLGVALVPPLKPQQTSRLRKALPGYAGILDDVATLLENEDGFQVSGVTPQALLEAQGQQKFLSEREAIAKTVHRNLFEQRLIVDDQAMKMLEKIARRVGSLKEDDPDLPSRWKLLLDFLGTFRGGGGQKTIEESAPAEE